VKWIPVEYMNAQDEWQIYVTWRTKGIPQWRHLVEINTLVTTHSSHQFPASQFLQTDIARLENKNEESV